MTGQLQLLPSSPPSQWLERVELDRLDGFADAKPSRELHEQRRAIGMLQPIVAVPTGDGRFRIVDGRRRAHAIAQLAEQGEWPDPPAVDVLILEGADTGREAVRAGLTLAVVRYVTREQTSTSAGELPDGLFAQQEAPWQVTVRGHLNAALAAIPRGDGTGCWRAG